MLNVEDAVVMLGVQFSFKKNVKYYNKTKKKPEDRKTKKNRQKFNFFVPCFVEKKIC